MPIITHNTISDIGQQENKATSADMRAASAEQDLFITKLINNPFNKVCVYGLRSEGSSAGKPIVGYLKEVPRFSASSQYSSPGYAEYLKSFNAGIQEAYAAINTLAGWSAVKSYVGNSILASMKSYQMSDSFDFSVSMFFVATKKDDNIMKSINPLFYAVYPDFDASSVSTSTVIQPPNGYTPGNHRGDISDNSGLLKITIGNWFKTKKVYLLESLDIAYSNITTSNGAPLMADVTLKFVGFRNLSAREVVDFFTLDPNGGQGVIAQSPKRVNSGNVQGGIQDTINRIGTGLF